MEITAHLEYESWLRRNFTRASVIIEYLPTTLAIMSVFISHYRFGTIEINNGKKEVHRWEDEEEARNTSSLSRHFTQLISDGIINDDRFEHDFLNAIREDIASSEECPNREQLLQMIDFIAAGDIPVELPPTT